MARTTSGSGGSSVNAQIEGVLQQRLQQDVKVMSSTRVGTDNLGKPIYKITYRAALGGFGVEPLTTTKTYTFAGGKLADPQLQGSGIPGGSGASKGYPDHLKPIKVSYPGESDILRNADHNLDQAKQQWHLRIERMNISDERKSILRSLIENYSGSVPGLARTVEQHPAFWKLSAPDMGDDGGFGVDTGGGGGGFGGGFAGPTYRAPDRRVVEDFVKGTMVSLLGTVQNDLLDPAVNLYMQDHRRNFDSAEQEIDPAQSVLEFMRNTEDYQAIHALRPESEDERTWISDRREAAVSGGLTVDDQEMFAIQQATVGGDLPDVQRAAATEQVAQSGTVRGTSLEGQLRNVATNLFEAVR